jgi:hypothetical protein
MGVKPDPSPSYPSPTRGEGSGRRRNPLIPGKREVEEKEVIPL